MKKGNLGKLFSLVQPAILYTSLNSIGQGVTAINSSLDCHFVSVWYSPLKVRPTSLIFFFYIQPKMLSIWFYSSSHRDKIKNENNLANE